MFISTKRIFKPNTKCSFTLSVCVCLCLLHQLTFTHLKRTHVYRSRFNRLDIRSVLWTHQRENRSIRNTNIIKTVLKYIESIFPTFALPKCNYSYHVLSMKFVRSIFMFDSDFPNSLWFRSKTCVCLAYVYVFQLNSLSKWIDEKSFPSFLQVLKCKHSINRVWVFLSPCVVYRVHIMLPVFGAYIHFRTQHTKMTKIREYNLNFKQ